MCRICILWLNNHISKWNIIVKTITGSTVYWVIFEAIDKVAMAMSSRW